MAQALKSLPKSPKGLPSQSTRLSEDSSSRSELEIYPQEVTFRDIQPEQTYEMSICVRNLSSHVRRIRFTPPKTSRFSAKFETLGALAVGLATNIEVSFETDTSGDYHDQIRIHSEGYEYVLLLHALSSQPDILYDPFVNLGFTTINRPATGSVLFRNEGKISGEVALKYDKQSISELTIVPETFTLHPNSELPVALSFKSREVSTFRCVIDVEIEGSDSTRHIDINANCVDQQMALVAGSLEPVGEAEMGQSHMVIATSLEFRTMYHGQRKEIQAYLVNVGPFPVRYQVKFVQGSEEEAESETYLLMTPQELANQSIKRIIDASPLQGEVSAFSQLPITFICNSKKRESNKGWQHNLLDPHSQANASMESSTDYFYTALFVFAELEQRLTVQMQARAVLPSVKISDTSIHFHECPLKEQRDYLLKLENLNEELPIDFAFSKVANFVIEPDHGELLPLQTRVVNVTFKPGNFGVFEAQSQVSFLQGTYSFNLCLYGQSSTEGSRTARPRGPESLSKDFEPLRRYISTEDVARGTQVQAQHWLQPSLQSARMSESNLLQAEVRDKYNAYLRDSRNERLMHSKSQRLAALSQSLPRTFEEIQKNTDFCLSSAPVSSKLLMLPPPRDPLYVEKPMGKYDTAASATQDYNHDPDKPIKNVLKRPIDRKRFEEIPFNERPQKQLEMRECTYSLTPMDMHFISAGPKEINYDKMVIRAESGKWFSVVNDLKQHILVELVPAADEVHRIEPPSLVIPPGQKGGFRVVLMSAKKQRIVTSIKYLINGKYEFNFRVVAEVEPAVLELALSDATSSLATALFLYFRFDDENLEESLTKPVNVFNRCGAPTKFTWTTAADSNFSVEPAEDIIEPMKQKSVAVKFTPGMGKNNEETLVMKVDNGESQALNCRGEINPSECFFTSKNVDFGMVAVGVRTEKQATLKNNKPKYAIFHVKKVPAQLEIFPMRGRIPGDGKFLVKLNFISLIEEEVTEEIEVSIRGGKLLRLVVHANAIIPQVFIQEPDIDFGGVTVGSQSIRRFTLINESPIPTVLYLNLDEHPEFDLSMVVTGDADNESAMVANATGDKESPFYIKEEDEDDEDPKPDLKEDESEEEEGEEEEEETYRKYRISISATHSVLLALRFVPKETDIYQFTLPFILAGINTTVSGLQRTVSGEGLKPRFYLEKTIVDFDKKVISLQEKSFPVFRHPLISNPEIHSVKWRVDTTGIDKAMTFAIKPNEGVLEPGNFSHMHVSFNPTQPVAYEEHVNLYLDGAAEAYMSLTLLGQGTVPRILFDRREVILPIVPLNITSKVVFFIVNDGYENVELDYKIVQDAVKLDISLNFPDGRQLGSTKQRLAVEAVFQSPKPISFTARIDFMDSDKIRYPIAVSGTADNSLLTAFPFIQRNTDEVRFEVDDAGVINLVQDAQSDTDSFSEKGAKGARTSAGSSVFSRSAKSIIGFNPVPQPLMERSLEFLVRWLNAKLLTSPVNKLPDDFIEANGAQLYEILTTLCGKTPPGQVKFANIPQREVLKKLLSQYETLLKWLKENGALLNTIRPEYLLSMADFGRYLKSTPEQLQLKSRQIERRFPYLSMDAWITLLYQILKVFGLSRITPKMFKTIPGMSPEQATIDAPMTQSNIYSLSESILLKWFSYHFASAYPMTSRKVRNFDQDLLDGTVLAAAVQNHIGAVGSLLKVKFNALSEEQKKANVERVLAALNENGLQNFVMVRDLSPSQISAREMVLFAMVLMHSLPQYVSKTTIEFPCILGETLTKTIQLTNPSNKQITYWVKLEGSSDFQLDHPDDFSIPARSTEGFPIRFQSRLSNSISAKLRFTSRAGEGSARAAVMVFMLVSKVVARKSERVFETESSLYELVTKDVEVRNTFGKDAEFTVQLVYPEKERAFVPKKGLKRPNPKKILPTVTFPPPFYLKNDRIKVKKGLTNTLSVQFLPFELDRQEAYLIFVDENVGEMQYSIVGNVLPPKVDKQDKFEPKRDMGNLAPVEIAVSTHNHLLESAKREVMSRYQSAAKTKEREALKEIFKNLTEEITTFEVSINSPFFSGPTTFTITDAGKNRAKAANLDTSQASIVDGSNGKGDDRTPIGSRRDKSKKRSVASSIAQLAPDKVNMLSLGFTPRQPGDYVCQVNLVSTLKTDLRALDIVVTVKPKKARISLEMTTTARNIVTQEIPITNNSDKDWNVKIRLIQEGDAFSVSRDFAVRKKTSGNCTVTFKPEWVCTVTARLEMDVVTTSEVYEFELLGQCDEPRAEDHLVLQCRVKEKTFHYISLSNAKSYPVTYRVESDIAYAIGESTIEIPPYGSKNYELVLYPLQSGTYTGSITFKDPQNRFYWYTLEVHCATPEPEDMKELRIQCRKALEFKITVYNPLSEDTIFDVNVVGEGLYGDTQFAVVAKEMGYYTLTYSPLLPMQSEGAVSFLSEKTGEFWYRLRLICDPAEPVEKELFECGLGKSLAKSVMLENPSSKEVVLDYFCSNTLNFELIPDQIILPAYGSMEALIKYTPTSLKFLETAEIRLTSKTIGDWMFKVKGKGTPPSEMEPMIVTAGVGETNSIQVPFKNPFRDSLSVTIALETSHEEVFQLLLRRSKFAVGPMGLLMVPVAFKPQNMEELSATVLICASEELTWRFPLRGITERPSNTIDFVFKTKCRASLEKEIEVILPDLVSLPEEENFTHELQVQNPSLAALVLKSFNLEPRKNILSGPSDNLIFAAKFDPLRPFKTEAQLFIYKASGGRWKFNMLIEAKEPDVDDTIVIEAAMGKVTSVSFRLANHFKQYAAFTARFTEESDPCFTVTPVQGILEPYGKAGTQFLLTFIPSEYGAAKTAKLVITTEEMQWNYLVKGTHPHYKPPEVGGGRLDNHLSRELKTQMKSAQHLSKKNFIRDNIRTQRSPKRSSDS